MNTDAVVVCETGVGVGVGVGVDVGAEGGDGVIIDGRGLGVSGIVVGEGVPVGASVVHEVVLVTPGVGTWAQKSNVSLSRPQLSDEELVV